MMDISDCKFFDEWDENGTDIPWQQEGRRKLNAVIRVVNQWTIDGCDANAEIGKVLRTIECGIQTFGQRDGGEDWLEVLKSMRNYVRSIYRRTG